MPPDMTEDEAVAIARRFAEAEGHHLGPFSHAMRTDCFPEDNRLWVVWFEYDGPPPDPNSVSCPATDSPTIIQVDIFTGEAFMIGLL